MKLENKLTLAATGIVLGGTLTLISYLPLIESWSDKQISCMGGTMFYGGLLTAFVSGYLLNKFEGKNETKI